MVRARAGGAAVAFAAAALSSGAVAQDSPATGKNVSQFDEMVVTATRRDERLIDALASASVQRMDDLGRSGFTYGTDEFPGGPGVSFLRR